MKLKFTELGHDEFAFRESSGETVKAEITWTQMADLMVVEYTYVEESLRNQGLAKELVDHAAAYARENQFKMQPVCSYVAEVFERSDEYNDVKA
ncbi:N-acetyltransferase [Planococcus sp. CP5-4]|uniref:GNAT family N-acetyltransferase n=1 Tax=unclassified Planococcus (in: firmicutes) TaxID=2662419 RepID=UPI001C22DB31|nr:MULTISPECIES: GNAT family N-acetyltransferase [unclassified Planococcus (in: firmicutes)]MBU9672315.1 N-acetyltransferase [Planococcus sp. CP5-4_YE]MBV0909366.1 N-acetyltransferase [Planococcus sp. CP5-4_UN]MBW6064095.1 N-acetyltransferase [Planococcus sp. CP5-4]